MIVSREKLLAVLTGVFILACAARTDTSAAKMAVAEINNGAVILDVRTPEEYASGHIKLSMNVPHDRIEEGMAGLEEFQDQSVVVYCRSGKRASSAKEALEKNGFKNVTNAGGYADLKKACQKSQVC